ncbi:MAG: DUF4440 domain-containing protein [Pyrinomonadaceae bacterium]
MNKIGTFLIMALAVAMFAACGEPAANTNVNRPNAANGAVKPTAAAPTAEALLAKDKAANEAWIKGDVKHFEEILSAKFVEYNQGTRLGKADVAKMIGSFKCDVKSWNLDDPQMAKINDDTYVLSYKGTFDGTCAGEDGKSMKVPSPVRGATVWVRNGDKWEAAYHGETAIIDPNNPPAADKKEEPKKEEAKKDDTAKTDANSASNSASDAAPAKPTPSANTDALVKLHTSGWEAFKAKDAKKFEEMLSANAAIVDPIGGWISGKSNIIKHWTETMKCEGINNVKVEDGFATAVSPTVEILTLKGTADGTCDGQKNGGLYQTAV